MTSYKDLISLQQLKNVLWVHMHNIFSVLNLSQQLKLQLVKWATGEKEARGQPYRSL